MVAILGPDASIFLSGLSGFGRKLLLLTANLTIAQPNQRPFACLCGDSSLLTERRDREGESRGRASWKGAPLSSLGHGRWCGRRGRARQACLHSAGVQASAGRRYWPRRRLPAHRSTPPSPAPPLPACGRLPVPTLRPTPTISAKRLHRGCRLIATVMGLCSRRHRRPPHQQACTLPAGPGERKPPPTSSQVSTTTTPWQPRERPCLAQAMDCDDKELAGGDPW
jgi:hypothetical protein